MIQHIHHSLKYRSFVSCSHIPRLCYICCAAFVASITFDKRQSRRVKISVSIAFRKLYLLLYYMSSADYRFIEGFIEFSSLACVNPICHMTVQYICKVVDHVLAVLKLMRMHS